MPTLKMLLNSSKNSLLYIAMMTAHLAGAPDWVVYALAGLLLFSAIYTALQIHDLKEGP
jgi:hypothetical protein